MFEVIKGIEFSISSLCNLSCSYCFFPKYVKRDEYVTNDFQKLSQLLTKLPLDDYLWINCCGGEISLHDDVIRNGIKQVKRLERKQDIKIDFRFTTNGTNLERVLEWIDDGLLEANNIKLSWDGIYSSNTRCSDNKYDNDFFNSRIVLLGNSNSSKDMIVRYAITENTIDYLYDSLMYVLNNGCRTFEYYFLFDSDIYLNKDFQNKFREQSEMVYNEFAQRYNNKSLKWTFNNFDNLKYAQSNSKERLTKCSQMGSILYVDFNGNLYPCSHYIGNNAMSGMNIIGNVNTGLDNQLIDKFISEYHKECYNHKSECDLLHCVDCQGDNIGKIIDNRNPKCKTCDIRKIEQEIYEKLPLDIKTV